MKKTTFLLKNSFRIALIAGTFVTATCMLSACGESSEESTTTDTVTATEPAPVIDTMPVIVDSAVVDSGRVVMDPKKPE